MTKRRNQIQLSNSTSVSSPEFVGALALYEQFNHRQGNVNYLLYLAAAVQDSYGNSVTPSRGQFMRVLALIPAPSSNSTISDLSCRTASIMHR